MIALALLLAAAPPTLPDVQARLEKERAAALQLAGREASLLGRLADLERQIELESRAVRAAQARLRGANARLAQSDARARAAEEGLAAATAALGPRLTARYRLGREGYLRFLLGSQSIAELLRRNRLFNALLEADLDALQTLRFHADGARAARDEVAAARAELAEAVRLEGEKRDALQARVDQQNRILASVREERAAREEAVRELEEAEKDLTARLGELQAPAAQKAPVLVAPELHLEASMRKMRGKLLFPVDRGAVEVRFGRSVDPRFGIVSVSKGIDVRAPLGTPVHAVWSGKVVHAGWFKGFGNLLILDHGDGLFSLMAHLDQLERTVGEEVKAGDELGTVGETGSLKGAYLYFELRDGQKPLDPLRWLVRAKKTALLAGAKGGEK